MNGPATNKAQSVLQRLRNRLSERGEDLQFGLQRYAVERFLYRLGASAHRGRFVLKGAALFAIWGGAAYRPTRDLDLMGFGRSDEASILAAFRDICGQPGSDELVFNADNLSADPIRSDDEYLGLRLRLDASLGKSHVPLQIDVGFGNAIEPPPHDAEYPTLLDDPPPRIRAYPLEAVIAEKFHAMVVLGARNTRYKDFYDLHMLARNFSFDGKRLSQSIAATFERRSTPIETALPAVLTPRFFEDDARSEQWRVFRARSGLTTAPQDLAEVGNQLRSLLTPIWNALAANSPFDSSWPPGGSWGAAVASKPNGTARSASQRSFKRYAAHKHSGIEWLGEIPVGWDVERLKHVAVLNPEALTEDTDPTLEMIYVDIGGVDGLGRINEREQVTFASAPSRARRLVRDGDVIVSTVRTYLRAIAPIHNPEPSTVVSTGFAVVRPTDGLTSDYASYALRAPYFVERVVANSKGVSFPAINESEMATYELAIPPEPEQRAIAAFLDRETPRIDALVAKKERLIELLQEQRTSLITRAVTKGLDPNVPMKKSGVEWLGEIPAHWKLSKMWQVSDAISGGTPTKEQPKYWGGDIPWVSPKDMKRRFIDSSEDTITDQAFADTGLKLVLPPAVLIVVRGMILAHSFPVAVTTVPVTINQDMKALRLTPIIAPLFLAWLFEGIGKMLVAAVVEEASHGTRAIRMDQWRLVTIPVPPAAEQHGIATLLDRETARIDALVAKVREAIDRLEELRTALISAAVTGKIDVREEVA